MSDLLNSDPVLSPKPRGGLKKRKGLWLAVVGVFLLFPILGFVLFRLQTTAEVSRRLAAIRAQGFPTHRAEWEAWYAQPPSGERNAADVLGPAYDLIRQREKEREARESVGPKQKKGSIEAFLEIKPNEPIFDELRLKVGDYLKENVDALERLRTGAALEHCRYPVDFSQDYLGDFPHHYPIRAGSAMLACHAVLCAERGEMEGAVADVKAMIGLAHTLKDEPSTISQLFRGGILARGVWAIEHALNRGTPTEEQLRTLIELAAPQNLEQGIVRGLVGDRAIVSHVFQTPGLMANPVTQADSMPMEQFLGVWDAAHLQALDNFELAIQSFEHPDRVGNIDWQERTAFNLRYGHGGLLVSLSPISPTRMRYLTKLYEIELLVCRTGLAVQRYRLANGKLPGVLADLVPAFLSKVPEDPFGRGALVYKKLDKGFVVYSLGENRTDDGGTDEREDGREKDIAFSVLR